MKQATLALGILIGLAGLSGCGRVEPRAQAQSVAVSNLCMTDSDCERQAEQAKPKERHYCAGITKAGDRCRRAVKNEGDYCFDHAARIWEHAGHWDMQIGRQKLVEFATKAEAEAYLANQRKK